MIDKGLKRAISRQPEFKLPSNFSYRMMKRIEEETYLKEKRTEKKIFISWIITASFMTAGGLGYLGWNYNEQILYMFRLLKHSIPDTATLLLYLPAAAASVILFFFNKWLQKKVRQRLEES